MHFFWRKYKTLILFTFLCWNIVATIGLGMIYVERLQSGSPMDWVQAIAQAFPSYYVWAVLTPLVFWLGERFRLGVGPRGQTLGIHLALSFVMAILRLALLTAVSFWLNLYESELVFSEALIFYILNRLHFEVMIYWGVLGVGHAFDYYHKNRERQIQTARLEAALTQAQLQSLRMQLQPHFLFNTLHGISALMERDVPAARHMMVSLSELLRLTLEDPDALSVSLKRELALTRRYLDIQKIRFGEGLQIQWDIAPEAHPAQVPKLLFQPLVENAIRHGRTTEGKPLTLWLTAHKQNNQLILRLEDDGPGMPETMLQKSTGLGLANTQARLERQYGMAHRWHFGNRPKGGFWVEMTLPFYTETETFDAREDPA